MNLTIDFPTFQILVFEPHPKLPSHCVFIRKWDGKTETYTIPQMIKILKDVKEFKENEAKNRV